MNDETDKSLEEKLNQMLESIKENANSTNDSLNSSVADLLELAKQIMENPEISPLLLESLKESETATDGAELFSSRAYNMLKSERYAEAKRFFLKAIDIKPDHLAAWVGIAAAYDGLDEKTSAAQARLRAQELRLQT